MGRGVVANIYEGEPILEDRLASRGAGAGMAATIPMGMRAVAVRVNDIVGIAGFATPGMRVDILIMGTTPSIPQQLGTLSRTLLQNIEILSAGQEIQKNNEGKPMPVQVVNLLVSPEQAEIISLASNDARIQLILRNPLDTKETKTSGTCDGTAVRRCGSRPCQGDGAGRTSAQTKNDVAPQLCDAGGEKEGRSAVSDRRNHSRLQEGHREV